MSRAKIIVDDDKRYWGVRITCPGCKSWHTLPTDWMPAGYERSPYPSAENRPSWNFNGDLEKPTFEPSILTRAGSNVCHSFVRDGRIQFLGDCTHALAGKTVDLPEIGVLP